MDNYWLSECCEAPPLGEVDMGIIEEGVKYHNPIQPLGFCSECYNGSLFFTEDTGEPFFDTKEEHYGER